MIKKEYILTCCKNNKEDDYVNVCSIIIFKPIKQQISMAATKISKHISYKEGTHSNTATRRRIRNEPNEEQLASMKLLAKMVFEPLRVHFDTPIRINSFFRSVALNKAIGGGIAGSIAMTTEVFSLMWLRTTMNYQYRYGTSTSHALKTLYKEGGIRRFYRGIGPALIQGPISRFGDTAINTGVLYYCNNNDDLKDLPIFVKTGIASFGAAGYRIFTMPIDTCKTIMQVEGKSGLSVLKKKINRNGIPVL